MLKFNKLYLLPDKMVLYVEKERSTSTETKGAKTVLIRWSIKLSSEVNLSKSGFFDNELLSLFKYSPNKFRLTFSIIPSCWVTVKDADSSSLILSGKKLNELISTSSFFTSLFLINCFAFLIDLLFWDLSYVIKLQIES